MDRIGSSAIVALLEKGDLAQLQIAGVTQEHFFDESKQALVFIKDYHAKYGKLPTVDVVETHVGEKLPDVKSVGTAEYELNRVKERKLGLDIQKTLTSAAKDLEDRNPAKALDRLKLYVNSDASAPDELTSAKDSVEDRIEIYDSVRSIGGLVGVPSPWEGLNLRIQGWVDGTMNVVAAPSNHGKSWMTVLCAEEGLKHGDVLLVTLEMSTFRLLRRLDAVLTKEPWHKVRDSAFDDAEFKAFKSKLKTTSTKGDLFVADKSLVRTAQDVTTLIYQKKPSLVIVDGAYRFETGASDKNKWAGIVSLCNDIQDSAEMTNTPWVITTQHGDASEKDGKSAGTKPNPWKVRYGKEFFINSDVFLNMHQTPEMRMLKIMELHVGKMRDFAGISNADEPVRIRWDMEAMNFEEIGATSGSTATPPLVAEAIVAF